MESLAPVSASSGLSSAQSSRSIIARDNTAARYREALKERFRTAALKVLRRARESPLLNTARSVNRLSIPDRAKLITSRDPGYFRRARR